MALILLIFVALPTLLIGLLAVQALARRRKGTLKFRGWVLAVFLVAVLLSFRYVVDTMLVEFFLPPLLGGDALSMPFEQAWNHWSRLLYCLWLPVFAAILLLRGAKNAEGRIPWWPASLAAIVIGSFLFADAAIGLAVNRVLTWGTRASVAVAPSPDGRMRVRAILAGFLDADYFLVAESNTSLPVVSRRLANGGGRTGGGRYRLAWSSDSQVVVLWMGERPVVGYDFSRQQEFPGQFGQQFTGGFAPDRLMAAHGGEAPEHIPEPTDEQAAAGAFGGWGYVDRRGGEGGHVIGVDVARSQITDAHMVGLRRLDHLETLNVVGTRITDAGLKEVGEMPSLRRLILARTGITDACLAPISRLKDLEELNLDNTAVTDAGLERVGRLANLRRLAVGWTRVTDAGMKHVGGLRRLEWLDLTSTQVGDAGLAELKGLGNLQQFCLGQTKVTDAGMAALGQLKGLQNLVLFETTVTDAGLKELKGLKSLRRLQIAKTRVTDAGVADFRQALPTVEIVR